MKRIDNETVVLEPSDKRETTEYIVELDSFVIIENKPYTEIHLFRDGHIVCEIKTNSNTRTMIPALIGDTISSHIPFRVKCIVSRNKMYTASSIIPIEDREIKTLSKCLTKEEVTSWIRQLIPYLENPAYLAPKGSMKSSEVGPGKVIEYDSTLIPNKPEPILQTENLRILVSLYKELNR